MDLFKVDAGVVKPTEHALLIPPYSDIWKRDKSGDKHDAIRQFTYIEFMCSMKKSNIFKGYPENTRHDKIVLSVFKGEEFEVDDLIKEGMELYLRLNIESSITIQYFLGTKLGAEKVIDFLKNVDLTERNSRDMPLYKPKEITSSLSDAYNVMKTLNAMEEKVYEELFESVKSRGNKTINHFEE